MNNDQFERLRVLARLSAKVDESCWCKICGSVSRLFDVVDFNKVCSIQQPYSFGSSGITVRYFRCGRCSLMFTDFCDQWTTEDFSQFIYNADYQLVDPEYLEARPKRDAAFVMDLLQGESALTVLDYGGGAGVLATTLRQNGWDAETYDPFSSPLRPIRKFDVLTCFEVIEHSPDPRAMLADMVSLIADGGCIVLGTGLQPDDIHTVRGSWWYVGPRNGHITIFSEKALTELAGIAGLTFHAGSGMAFASPNPSAGSEMIAARVGPCRRVIDVYAPDTVEVADTDVAGRPSDWHRAEPGSPPFRWTATDRPVWKLRDGVKPGRLTVRLAIKMEIEPGFALRCSVAVGGAAAPVEYGHDGYFAMLDTTDASVSEITLLTPPPQRPPGGDTRTLGLAFETVQQIS